MTTLDLDSADVAVLSGYFFDSPFLGEPTPETVGQGAFTAAVQLSGTVDWEH